MDLSTTGRAVSAHRQAPVIDKDVLLGIAPATATLPYDHRGAGKSDDA